MSAETDRYALQFVSDDDWFCGMKGGIAQRSSLQGNAEWLTDRDAKALNGELLETVRIVKVN